MCMEKQKIFAKIDKMLNDKGMTYLNYLESKKEKEVKVNEMQLDKFLDNIAYCSDCAVTLDEDCNEFVNSEECRRKQKEFLQVEELESRNKGE